jgi:hypothetical protein
MDRDDDLKIWDYASQNDYQMIVIDAETGEYGIDPSGVETAMKLKWYQF